MAMSEVLKGNQVSLINFCSFLLGFLMVYDF